MPAEPCEQCDFIGPLWPVTQQSTDLHRAWHDVARTWQHAVGPLINAWREIGRAAREASREQYALTPPTDTGEPMTTTTPAPETWRVEVGDDVVLTRGKGRAEGPVTQVDLSATKGTGLRIDGHPLPFWVGNHPDTWTLAEHHPAMPAESDLIVNGLYEITRDTGNPPSCAYWAPVDGIRANHPWLHPDGKTRHRRGSVIRARLVQREIATVVEALEDRP